MLTIAVTYAKVQNIATANRVLGSASADGIVSEVQVATDMIANDAVTDAKIATSIDAIKLADGSVHQYRITIYRNIKL